MTRLHEGDQLPFRHTRLFLLRHTLLASRTSLFCLKARDRVVSGKLPLAFLHESRHRERYCSS
jgi:hypothetical protein